MNCPFLVEAALAGVGLHSQADSTRPVAGSRATGAYHGARSKERTSGFASLALDLAGSS